MNTSINRSTPTPSDERLYPLQHLVMPNLDFGGVEEMYVRRLTSGVLSVFSEKKLCFFPGNRCALDTFYNSLTVQSWQENCQIPDLSFTLEGQGTFIIRIGLRRKECDRIWLTEKRVIISDSTSATLEIEAWPSLVNGMIYAEIESVTPGYITGGWFGTKKAPERDIRLGIVITHFKREKYVTSAARRIRNGLLNHPTYKDQFSLIIVDNSQTLSNSDVEGATLIPNQNLGGAGGFTRGLLHLKDASTFTHCLFMDDDASCELESILRAHTLLGYATGKKVAVAGALLRELAPHFLFEKGAQFDRGCRPLKNGLDMRKVDHLLLSETVDQKSHFGGWWFFAFSLNDVERYAFPFFVRGDDVMFGMMNKFDILTQNGIACYGGDFGYKNGPLQIYLDVRNHLVQNMTHLDTGVEDCVKLIRTFFKSYIYSYHYATARAISKAILDVMKGHTFWLENMDTSVIRKEMSPLIQEEKLQKLRLTDITSNFVKTEPLWSEGKKRRLLRRLTLNGILLPSFLRKKSWMLLEKNFAGDIRSTFRHENVLYYYTPTQEGFCAHRNVRRFIEETIIFRRSEKTMRKNYSKVKADYQKNISYMTSEDFWRKIYSET